MLLDERNFHGGDIWNGEWRLDFSANINPYGMPEAVTAALVEAVKRGECACYPDPYCRLLREKIAVREGIAADNILCGNGAAELVYSFACSLPKGIRPLIVAPSFCEYERALTAAELPVAYYPLAKENGFVLGEEIIDQIEEGTGALFVCSPNNPTGISVNADLLWRIAAKCEEKKTRFFCDFSFMDLVEEPFGEVAAFVMRNPCVFVLKAFTKNYAMAGLRLGYALCADQGFLNNVSRKTSCWNVSVLSQKAGIAALLEAEYVKECRQKIGKERRRLKGALRGMGITVYPGEANFLLLESELPIHEQLAARGILTRSCADYPFLDERFVRIAVRTERENTILLDEISRIVGREKKT